MKEKRRGFWTQSRRKKWTASLPICGRWALHWPAPPCHIVGANRARKYIVRIWLNFTAHQKKKGRKRQIKATEKKRESKMRRSVRKEKKGKKKKWPILEKTRVPSCYRSVNSITKSVWRSSSGDSWNLRKGLAAILAKPSGREDYITIWMISVVYLSSSVKYKHVAKRMYKGVRLVYKERHHQFFFVAVSHLSLRLDLVYSDSILSHEVRVISNKKLFWEKMSS